MAKMTKLSREFVEAHAEIKLTARARSCRDGANTSAALSRTGTRAAGKSADGTEPSMKHASIRARYDYWKARCGARLAPECADIEPEAIRNLLADSFILAFEPCARHPYRIAGTRFCVLFGRELQGEAFLNIWATGARSEVDHLLAIVA
jgi:hypothetical protein